MWNKYRLERRSNSKPASTMQTKMPSTDSSSTPQKRMSNGLSSKLSFSSTPKTNELTVASKEWVLVSK